MLAYLASDSDDGFALTLLGDCVSISLMDVELNSDKAEEILRGISLLYVEDDEVINRQLSIFLRRRVKNLFTACNGREGLEVFKTHTPDMVVTDINMPDMDGIQMVRHIKEIRHDTKIILTTAFNDEEYFIRAIDANVDSFMKKPIDPYKLLETMINHAIVSIQKKEVEEKSRLINFILNNSIGDAVISTDVRGNVTFINPAAQYMLGCLVEHVYGKPLSGVFTITGNGHDKTLTPESLIKNEVIDLTNQTLQLSGGQQLRIYGSTSPIRDDNDNFRGVVIIFQDLDKLREAQERLSYHRERFISVLIHDIKTPLIAISGYARRFLLGKAKSDEDKSKLVGNIQNISDCLLNTIEETSNLLREKGALNSCNLEHLHFDKILTAAIINCLPAMDNRGISLSVNNHEGIDHHHVEHITLVGDQRQLINMIENLLSNATKYARSSIRVSYDRDDVLVRLTVTDDGPGIDECYIDKIFDPYYQIPGSVKGTGLGLYSVKKVVENHKGTICVRSQLKAGSTFEVTIPCDPLTGVG